MAPRAAPTPPAEAPPASPTRADARSARALTSAIARGDQLAFEHFYNEHFELALDTARDLTRRDESFCLDIVQDAMIRAARGMKRFDTHDQLRAWMRRVVYTAALDRLRAERRRLARERARTSKRTPANEPDPTDERIAWVRAQLADLPPDDRSLLLLRVARGGTIAQAARALGMSPGAAHGRIRRALQRLRDAGKDLTP